MIILTHPTICCVIDLKQTDLTQIPGRDNVSLVVCRDSFGFWNSLHSKCGFCLGYQLQLDSYVIDQICVLRSNLSRSFYQECYHCVGASLSLHSQLFTGGASEGFLANSLLLTAIRKLIPGKITSYDQLFNLLLSRNIILNHNSHVQVHLS